MSAPVLVGDYLERFVSDLLADAMANASATQWRRRADQFAAVGTASCDVIATACRNHAALLDGSWQRQVDA